MHSIVSECILRAATHATLDFQNCKIIVVRNLAQRNDYLDATGDYYGCAQMCGTSIKMLEKRYSHPDVERIQERYLAYMAGR